MSNSTDHVSNNDEDLKTTEGGVTSALSDSTETITQTADTNDEFLPMEKLSEEKEYSEKEYNEMLDLYEKTLSEFVEGELIVGKVLAVNDNEVTVDIGFKSDGVIPIEEFSNPKAITVGDDIEVYLDNVEDSDGQLVLSKKKADFLRVWEKIIESHEKEEILEGTCTRRIKGGIVVDLMGVDAFLPGSQIDVKPIRDFDALIGKTMDFKIVKVNELRKNIVVSHRALIEEGMKEQRQKILENLEKGQILEGSVKNITDFGVFIDLGGVDGLLHINDLSWGRVNHPSEVVALDEKIKIQILDFNEEKDRISLGLKQLQPHPWDDVKDKYKEGDVVKGKVVNIADYGSFIELEKGIEGLIHISEMSWTQHIKHPSKLLSLGETLDAKILTIDYDGRKISLGIKQLEPDPWSDIGAKYPVDSKQKGVVRNLTNFGAFVELEEGVDGLIHISDLSWTKKIRHPGEVVKKGDEVEIVVLNIDKNSRRISLGYKQTMENPWDTFEETYKPQAKTKGKIVRMIEKGVIVELPEVVDGFVPLSQLQKQGIKRPADGYKVGDEIEVAVIEFNKENKKIILSEKLAIGSDSKTELAIDDQEAIAEFEKEAGVGDVKKPGTKTTPKSKKSEPEAAETDDSVTVDDKATAEQTSILDAAEAVEPVVETEEAAAPVTETDGESEQLDEEIKVAETEDSVAVDDKATTAKQTSILDETDAAEPVVEAKEATAPDTETDGESEQPDEEIKVAETEDSVAVDDKATTAKQTSIFDETDAAEPVVEAEETKDESAAETEVESDDDSEKSEGDEAETKPE